MPLAGPRAVFGQAGGGVHRVVGAQRDHERVRLVRGDVGRGAARLGVDRRDRLAQEAHARLDDLRVGQPHRLGARAAEHHIQLGEAEHERVALVDQRHLDVVAQLLRQHRRELQPAEPRPQH